jgi:ATP-binding cassette subfamily B (MDR/TAP) protein 1
VITLDGLDIKTLNIKWLRSQIGYVGQEPVLFEGTIAENIASGLNTETKDILKSTKESQQGQWDRRREELMEQVISAARLANAHDFISQLPQGYETDVGSNGIAMSGGQKQRIAIARALIKKPAVLLLDEATSALDAASEKVVQQSIDELARSKAQTTIIIAHRLSTIRNADKICMIQDGKIVETGTHDELIERHGAYAELVSLQLQAEEEPVAKADETGDKFEEVNEDVVVTGRAKVSTLVNEDQKKAVSEQAVKLEPLSKEASKSVSRKIWSLMLEHPFLFLIGLLGGACFGAVFPVWGLLLANSQNMFYLSDTNEVRQRARVMALSFVGIAGFSLLSCTALYFGTTAVVSFHLLSQQTAANNTLFEQMGEKISSKLRSELFEAFLRRDIGYYDREENSVGEFNINCIRSSC